MGDHRVFIGLGSNTGDRAAHLTAALFAMQGMLRISARSRIYETEPVGFAAQGWFLNMVVEAHTRDGAHELLKRLQTIERELGRVPTVKNGPRCIDLDILFYDDLLLNEPDLVIPHPGVPNRGFVLAPLCDIAPDLMHPVLRQPVRRLLDQLCGSARVRLWPHDPLPP